MDLDFKPPKTTYYNLYPRADNFLTAPASLAFKKIGAKKFTRSVNCKATAHLGFDRKGRIYFYITGNTHRDNFRIIVSKWSLLQMLKFHLTLRPIRKQTGHKVWLNERQLSKAEIEKVNMESITFKELSEEYKEIKDKLERRIQTASPENKRKAEWQLQEMIELQCKIDVLAGIEKSKKFLDLKAGSSQKKHNKNIKFYLP
ncbi:MAG: hypothetical protein ACM3UU_05865 [Ignavibacteriales bacterium]